jgi:hypothetical protein
MNPLTTALRINRNTARRVINNKPALMNTPHGETDAMLRDIAFVLQMTRKVKEAMVEEEELVEAVC